MLRVPLALRPVLLLAASLAGPAALGQPGAPGRALAAFQAGDVEAAAPGFFLALQEAKEPEARASAEYHLASSLQRAGLPLAAVVAFTPLVKAGPAHPFHLKAVEAVVELQETLEDDLLVPALLNATYDRFSEAWRRLPPEALVRINYLIGKVAHRKGQLEEARQFLEAVPRVSRNHARAQALLGVTLGDPRYPVPDPAARRATLERAQDAFRASLAADPDPASVVHQVALLGLARTAYELGEYAEASRSFRALPRGSPFQDQALLEDAFARFQGDDPGGALGALHGLTAPRFALAFQPEAPILAATTYYFACLYPEALAELDAFDARYRPLAAPLQKLLEAPPGAPAAVLALLEPGAAGLPPPLAAWTRSSQRLQGLLGLLAEARKEAAAVRARPAWVEAQLAEEVAGGLEQNRIALEQVAAAAIQGRLTEAWRSLKGFADQAEILRFEVAKAEKEAAEAGRDPRAALDGQALLRPPVPSERWVSWPFQGEYWRDEVGAYRYTLQRACPGAR